jgi:hypothetical protein
MPRLTRAVPVVGPVTPPAVLIESVAAEPLTAESLAAESLAAESLAVGWLMVGSVVLTEGLFLGVSVYGTSLLNPVPGPVSDLWPGHRW